MQLFCTHGQTDYRVMLWYRRLSGEKALTLIGFGYGKFTDDSVEAPFREHFELSGDLMGDKKNVSLSIRDIKSAEHSATYFCAASQAHYMKQP